MPQTLNENVKCCYRKKKVKNNVTSNTFHEPLPHEWIDGRYRPPALICHASQGNEYLHNLGSGLY